MELFTDYSKDLVRSDSFKGSLQITKSDAVTGEILEQYESENLVVNNGRSGMAHLWAGQWFGGPPTGWVNTMKFGDRGYDPSDPTLPKDSSVDRTQLFCEDESRPIIVSKAAIVDFPDGDEGNKVRFTVSLGAAEGNGTGTQGYSEAGMYRVDGLLAAHKTFGIITKNSSVTLTFRWTFQF
jgi:hypothetical protein